VLPGNDPLQGRPDLPKLERKPPRAYRTGWQLEERLTGLGVALIGVVGVTVAYLITTGVLPAGLPPPAPPPGVLVQVPLPNAMGCVVPLTAVGGVALIVIGFRRVLDP
jgi:hypothetical protein